MQLLLASQNLNPILLGAKRPVTHYNDFPESLLHFVWEALTLLC